MKRIHILLIAASVLPNAALAADDSYFFGVEALHHWRHGSSNTQNGGDPAVAGGIVKEVKFSDANGFGANFGYRFDPHWSVFASYQYVKSDISWWADFVTATDTNFRGDVTSHVALINLGYDFDLTDRTALQTSVGIGFSRNGMSNLTEHDRKTDAWQADLFGNTQTDFASQISAGISHKVTDNLSVQIKGKLDYVGGFETKDYRVYTSRLDINPYVFDDVWSASIGASLKLSF